MHFAEAGILAGRGCMFPSMCRTQLICHQIAIFVSAAAAFPEVAVLSVGTDDFVLIQGLGWIGAVRASPITKNVFALVSCPLFVSRHSFLFVLGFGGTWLMSLSLFQICH